MPKRSAGECQRQHRHRKETEMVLDRFLIMFGISIFIGNGLEKGIAKNAVGLCGAVQILDAFIK